MKIVSDNPELLREIKQALKKERVKVREEKASSDVTDKGILEDIVQLVIEYPDESKAVVLYVLDEVISLANREHIYVVKKDGSKITYAEYEALSDEEKAKDIF